MGMTSGSNMRVTNPIPAPLTAALSNDVHQQAMLLDTWNQEYSQISNGCFRGSVESICLEDIRLFVERMNQRVLQRGAILPDTLGVGIPLSMAGDAILCGHACCNEDIHIFSSSGGFEYVSPPGFSFIGIEIPLTHDVRAILSQDWLIAARGASGVHKIRLRKHKADEFRDAVSSLFQMIRAHPALFERNARMRRALVGAVADIIQDGEVELGQNKVANPWKLIRQMRELTLRDPDCPMSVAELVQVLGTSRRSIQYACQRIMQITPVEYLRAIRLNHVRRELQRGETVTDAATEWGFWHLSNFAKDYKRLFGELPSDTMRRARPQR